MEPVIVEKTDFISQVVLNRIDIHNAFDETLIANLTETFERLAACKSTRVIILRSNGKHFCAGADLAWMQRTKTFSHEENLADAKQLAELLFTMHNHPKPIIASVHGAAYGGGIGLIAACDMAVAADNATFCFSEVKLGLIPAVISPYIIKAIGERATKQLFLTAEQFNAAKGLTLGLIQSVVKSESLIDTTYDYAKQIAANGPEAVAHCKRLVNQLSPLEITPAVQQLTANAIATRRVSKEGQEGLTAFFEKRRPQWRDEHHV